MCEERLSMAKRKVLGLKFQKIGATALGVITQKKLKTLWWRLTGQK